MKAVTHENLKLIMKVPCDVRQFPISCLIMESRAVNGYPGRNIMNKCLRKQRGARKTHGRRAGRPCERWKITQTCVLCRLCSLFSCLYCVFFIVIVFFQLLTAGRISGCDGKDAAWLLLLLLSDDIM